MAIKNIQMQVKNESGGYDILYLKTLSSMVLKDGVSGVTLDETLQSMNNQLVTGIKYLGEFEEVINDDFYSSSNSNDMTTKSLYINFQKKGFVAKLLSIDIDFNVSEYDVKYVTNNTYMQLYMFVGGWQTYYFNSNNSFSVHKDFNEFYATSLGNNFCCYSGYQQTSGFVYQLGSQAIIGIKFYPNAINNHSIHINFNGSYKVKYYSL